MGSWIALLLLICAGLFLVLKGDMGTIMGLDPTHFASLIASLALLIYFSSSLSHYYKNRFVHGLRDFTAWIGVMLLLVAVYSYRYEFLSVAHRVAGELLPPGVDLQVASQRNGRREVRIRRRLDGHFIAKTHINGKTVRMIVDTGASTIVLRQQDAKKIGIKTNQLVYSVPVQTANGLSRAARVKLSYIAIGPLQARNVDTLIAKPGTLHESLLGISFLNRLKSYEFSGNYLTLRN